MSRFLRQQLFSLRFLCFAFLVVVCLNLGLIPLFDVDEGAFSEATREMLSSGVYAATYLDGVPRYDKPILIYWFQALSVSCFGVNEWAFRIPSAVFAGFWILALYRFTRETLSKHRAMIAALVLLNCALFGMVARAAFADALLNLWLSLALFDIYRYSLTPKPILIYRVYLWMALGMLTKGPVAVVIPLVVCFFYFIRIKQTVPMLKAFFNPVGWGLFLVILLPWLWMVYLDQGLGFLKGFIINHNIDRFTATKEGHGGHWYYYLVVFPLIILPFSGLLIRPLARIKAYFKHPLDAFLLIWMLSVLVIFSFSETQLPHYVMNAATPFAILVARYAYQYKDRFSYIVPSILVALVLLFLPVLASHYQGEMPVYVKAMLTNTYSAFSVSYYIAAVVLIAAFFMIHCKLNLPLWGKLVYSGFLQAIFLYYFLLPSLAQLQQEPVKEAALLARAAGANVVRYDITMPSFSVYRQAITPKRLPVSGEWVFTRAGEKVSLEKAIAPLRVITEYENGGIRLFKVVK